MPPLLLFCVVSESRHRYVFVQDENFAVNALAENQEALSVHFALSDPPNCADVAHTLSAQGCPLLKDCLVTIDWRSRSGFTGAITPS